MTDCIKILMFIRLGVLSADTLWQTLALFPIAMLGLWPGMKSSKMLNKAVARKIVLIMLVVSGLALTSNNLQPKNPEPCGSGFFVVLHGRFCYNG